jgi:diaminopimelate epimerase
VRFVKGHGTENDFVVLPDTPESDFDAELVRALCDRRAGIGADGALRVHRDDSGAGEWFMDYRNADGSVAETCGNGIRVFARYLVTAGLAAPGRLDVATRSGVRRVDVPANGSDITVDMGPATPLPDAVVTVGDRDYPAHGWSMGNPHLVVLDAEGLDALDLSVAPRVDPVASYPDGVNVEVVETVGSQHIRMRVHERGSGETRSCGTGACAAAVAAMQAARCRGSYVVDVPGGRLGVEWTGDGAVLLRGPAVLVASGDVDPASIGSRCVDRSATMG